MHTCLLKFFYSFLQSDEVPSSTTDEIQTNVSSSSNVNNGNVHSSAVIPGAIDGRFFDPTSRQWQYIDPQTGTKLAFSNESQAWVPVISDAIDQSGKGEDVTSSSDLHSLPPGDADRAKFMKFDETKQQWIFCDPNSSQKLAWDESTGGWQEIFEIEEESKEKEVNRRKIGQI